MMEITMDRKDARAARKDLKAARRADLDGSGPTIEERAPERLPGATAKFALLGEVLLVGLLVFAVGVVVVTLPAALAAGSRHLRRFLRAEGSSLAQFFGDVRAALPGGLAVGAVALLIGGALAGDIVVASSGLLPGGEIFTVIGWVGLIVLGAVLVGLSATWQPGGGWGAALRTFPGQVGRDVPGGCYLAATAVFVGVVTWALPPLIVPGLGCAVLAAVAIPERPRRRA